jgi:uncharacterized protein YdeI (YjbR/CyaY-like superfamily)
LTAHYFDSPEALRAWLEANHETETELHVGYFKKASGRQTLTWAQAVDEALCFGWIDSVIAPVDADRYTQRFTPRKRGSNWSAVNIAKVERLRSEGRMRPAGEAAFARRTEARSRVYAYEQRGEIRLDPEHEARFRANEPAWADFTARSAAYRKNALYWVMSAKRHETRERRLATLIEDSAAGRALKHLAR